MSSSRAIYTCELLARGVRYEPGSVEDSFARMGLERERKAQFLTTLAVINAIIETGNRIVAATTQSAAPQGNDTLQKTLDLLRSMLLPAEAERLDKKARMAKRYLEGEVQRGPVKFRPMSRPRKRTKR